MAALADSLSPTEHEWLVKTSLTTVFRKPFPTQPAHTVSHRGPVNLTLAGDSIWGTVEVDGDKLAWGDITLEAT